jgi:hypothetical protein
VLNFLFSSFNLNFIISVGFFLPHNFQGVEQGAERGTEKLLNFPKILAIISFNNLTVMVNLRPRANQIKLFAPKNKIIKAYLSVITCFN